MFLNNKFKLGDEVVCITNIENFQGYEFESKMKVGKIVIIENKEYGVEFNEFVNGHTLKNNKNNKDICENGHGLWCKECNILKLDNKNIEVIKEYNKMMRGNNMREELMFAKVKKNAIIPTKRDEDAGRDLYACFEEDFMVIKPLETKLVPTGIATAFSSDYYAQIQERGSTGSKGIKYGAGVIDSGYRGEWFVPITNCNQVDMVIAKKNVLLNYPSNYEYIMYPYEKAIAQFVMIEVPKFDEVEVSLDELKEVKSERGTGKMGSSGK